jgi:hypothetical protein
MSLVSITEAAKMAGVSRATIYNDIQAGTLSYESGPKEKKMIDVSELERVYKNLRSPYQGDESKDVNKRQERLNSASSGSADQIAVLQERLAAQKQQVEFLEDMLKKEQEERRREREAAKQFEEYFKEQLTHQGENIKNFTRLLEDQRGAKSNDDQSELKQTVLSLKEELENQKEETRKKEEARRLASIKRRAQIEKQQAEQEKNTKSMSFFKKLFG